jgi:hypothetical protein
VLYGSAQRWSIAGEGGRDPKGSGASSSCLGFEELPEQLVRD